MKLDPKRRTSVLAAVAIVAAIVAGVAAVVYRNVTGTKPAKTPAPPKTYPSLLVCDEQPGFQTGLRRPRAIAAATDGRIYVAGDKAVRIFEPTGIPAGRIALDGEPRCLTVGPDGRVYVGIGDHVEVHVPGRLGPRKWASVGGGGLITAVAVVGKSLCAAVYPAAEVLVYDLAGKQTGRFDGRNGRPGGGFILRGPHFDLAAGAGGLLHLANPGRFRVETYQVNGKLVGRPWGRPGDQVAAFAQCCNPVSIAVAPGGLFVTCEKGLTRVKLHSREGELIGVVAGPNAFAEHDRIAARPDTPAGDVALDVAVDSRGRILILDPCTGRVRIFTLTASAQTRPK